MFRAIAEMRLSYVIYCCGAGCRRGVIPASTYDLSKESPNQLRKVRLIN